MCGAVVGHVTKFQLISQWQDGSEMFVHIGSYALHKHLFQIVLHTIYLGAVRECFSMQLTALVNIIS